MKTFKIKNIVYYLIKNWEHKYCISEKGEFFRGFKNSSCEFVIVSQLANSNKARNIVLTQTIQGKKQEQAFDKKTLAFDTFNPGERSKLQKTVSFKDGNIRNFSKENLILSSRNKPNCIKISQKDKIKIKQMRLQGKTLKEIKNTMNLNCSTQNIGHIIRKR